MMVMKPKVPLRVRVGWELGNSGHCGGFFWDSCGYWVGILVRNELIGVGGDAQSWRIGQSLSIVRLLSVAVLYRGIVTTTWCPTYLSAYLTTILLGPFSSLLSLHKKDLRRA